MNIKSLFSLEFNSPFLRKVLSLKYKEDQFYKLPFGRLKGTKLYYRKDVNFHAMLGLWEKESLEILIRLFALFSMSNKKLTIADVGGNIGYYSIFFSRYLSESTEIFSFEPSSSILPVLRKNIMINNISNVKVLDLACADHVGNEEFFIGAHHHQSSLVAQWADNNTTGTKTVVPTVTLDYFFSKFNQHRFPDLIKMDIEGGGVYALKGCDQCIIEKRPFIIIESHTPDEDNAIIEVLQKYKYEAFRVNTGKWVKFTNRNYADPDGVWGTMLLLPAEQKIHFTMGSLN